MKRISILGVFVAAVGFLMGMTACSDNDSDNLMGETIEVDDVLLGAMKIDLVRWTDAIEFSYVFTNTTNSDIVVFDANLTGLNPVGARKLDDGTVQLFIGRSRLVGADAVTTPLIDGRLVVPEGTVQGRGFRNYPIIIPPAVDGQMPTVESPSSVDFCVGFSKAEDVLDTMIGNGSYEQSGGLDLQRFACQTITRPE